jgi:hypothetical protein
MRFKIVSNRNNSSDTSFRLLCRCKIELKKCKKTIKNKLMKKKIFRP